LAIVPGKAAVAEEVVLDTVDVAFELFMRIRAFFMSLAHVSILKPGWFPLQSAIMASEQILTYITATYGGRTPPVAFLVEAWAHTSHYFSEALRMQQTRSAAEIVGNLGAWENRWKWTPPTTNESSGASLSSAQPDNRNLQLQLDSVKAQLKKHQQAADRAVSWQNNQQQAKKQKGAGDGGGNSNNTQYGNGGGGGAGRYSGNRGYSSGQKKKGGKGNRKD